MNATEDYIVKDGKKLKNGYTTGSCAAAAAAASTEMLLSGAEVQRARLTTPNGVTLNLDVEKTRRHADVVTCAVKKYSGDDPDITNGIYIYATVKKTLESILITGGKGIGVVTKAGLSVEVGKAAINPVPMGMITDEVKKVAGKYGYTGGLLVEIAIPKGEGLAKRTYNPRLGIVGGLSVLGTTGIVEPMSNSAIIETFKLEMKQLKETGLETVLIVPGNYGKDFARSYFGVDFKTAVQCSNFIGEAVDYSSYLGFKNVVIMGHGGKLVKLAGGIMNTHSNMADCRMEILLAHTALVSGVTKEFAEEILGSITIDDVNNKLADKRILEQVWESVGEKIKYHVNNRLAEGTSLGLAVFGQNGILYESGDIKNMMAEGEKDER